jgi:hypothetical protein
LCKKLKLHPPPGWKEMLFLALKVEWVDVRCDDA